MVLILIVWIALDYRAQKARLRELDASGVTRRSGRSAADIMMSEPGASEAAPRSRRWLVALPLIGFLALAALFLLRLTAAIRRKFRRR